MEQVFCLYRCVNLDQTYTFIFAMPDYLTKSSE